MSWFEFKCVYIGEIDSEEVEIGGSRREGCRLVSEGIKGRRGEGRYLKDVRRKGRENKRGKKERGGGERENEYDGEVEGDDEGRGKG